MNSPERPGVDTGAAAPPTTPVATVPLATVPLAAQLEGRPVAEQVAVFEAEHARLQRRLSTIDQL